VGEDQVRLARSLAHLTENIAAAGIRLTAGDLAELAG
jgi:aryl-alcohol dehydrogenase-like predicted oxidoreductase